MAKLIEEATPRGPATGLLVKASHVAARFSRATFLGVRGILFDEAQRVFLVRHSYVKGWYFPGGGVEVGETAPSALARELKEEGNLVIDAPPLLHGLFFNKRVANRDHVAVYLVRQFHQTGPRAPDHEIVETGFFPVDRLPEGATRSVHARLAEVLNGAPISDTW